LVEKSYQCMKDIAPDPRRDHSASQPIVAEREDFPEPAKVVGKHRLWLPEDVERWRDAQPRVWAPVE
jgi:hypothetical protein